MQPKNPTQCVSCCSPLSPHGAMTVHFALNLILQAKFTDCQVNCRFLTNIEISPFGWGNILWHYFYNESFDLRAIDPCSSRRWAALGSAGTLIASKVTSIR